MCSFLKIFCHLKLQNAYYIVKLFARISDRLLGTEASHMMNIINTNKRFVQMINSLIQKDTSIQCMYVPKISILVYGFSYQ